MTDAGSLSQGHRSQRGPPSSWSHRNPISPEAPSSDQHIGGQGFRTHFGGTHSVHGTRCCAFRVSHIWCGLRAKSPSIFTVAAWSPLTHFPSAGALPSCLAVLLGTSLCRSQAQPPARVLSPRDGGGLGPHGWLHGGEREETEGFRTLVPPVSLGGTPGLHGPWTCSDQSLGFYFQFRLFSCPLLNEPALGMGFVQ